MKDIHFMDKLVKHTPFIWFLFLGVVLTKTSLFFPQKIGSRRIVAGWPLTVFIKEYERIGEIGANGSIVHSIVASDTKILFSKMFANVILWTIILFVTWWTYRTVEIKVRKNSNKTSKK